MVSELPTRALIVAPSNSGKSVLLQKNFYTFIEDALTKYLFSLHLFL